MAISSRPLLLAGLLVVGAIGGVPCASANDAVETQYQSQEDFLATWFGAQVPESRLFWLTGRLREQATEVLGHAPATARLRYWKAGRRSAWILEEIGKERPITVGIGIDAGQVGALNILTYRETRGWEVRNTFFTRQFIGAQLSPALQLDRGIDSISGATLSVQAVSRLARLALLLDQHSGTTP